MNLGRTDKYSVAERAAAELSGGRLKGGTRTAHGLSPRLNSTAQLNYLWTRQSLSTLSQKAQDAFKDVSCNLSTPSSTGDEQ